MPLAPLFVRPRLSFEKVAAETTLPPDANRWPEEILQELHKTVPYVADFDPQIVMDRVDAELGYALGHVSVMNKTEIEAKDPRTYVSAGLKEIRIPVIVRQGKLQPFDIFITMDSKMLPLTEMRLRRALFRPQGFDTTGKTPGDTSLVGQLYPPYRQNYGMGGGGGAVVSAGKTASAKTALSTGLINRVVAKAPAAALPRANTTASNIIGRAGKKLTPGVGGAVDLQDAIAMRGLPKTGSLLDAIRTTVAEEDYVAFATRLAQEPKVASALLANPTTKAALAKIASFEPLTVEKIAHAAAMRAPVSVVQVCPDGGGAYTVKSASAAWWSPSELTIDRGTLIRELGAKIALAADLHGGTTAAVGVDEAAAGATAEEPEASLATTYGIYRVETKEGQELIGFVIPRLLDLDGTELPISLFTNGSHTAVQAEICGVPCGEGAALFEGRAPRGAGMFFTLDEAGHARAMIPMELSGQIAQDGEMAYSGTTYDGRPVRVVQTHGIAAPTAEGETVLVPDTWKWLDLEGAKAVSLSDCGPQGAKTAAAPHTIEIRGDRIGRFDLSGGAVAKLAREERTDLSTNDALFVLAACGVAPSVATTKLAESLRWDGRAHVRATRSLTPPNDAATAEKVAEVLGGLPDLRRDLVKEAAEISNPLAVDTVLSLGFLNPENIHAFISHLPEVDRSQSMLCELLLASRLGLEEISQGALERAIRSTEEVVEGLRALAF